MSRSAAQQLGGTHRRPALRSATPRTPALPGAVQPRRDSGLRRTVDVVAAAAGLVCAGPILVALAGAVRLTSPGPAIYRQVRVGRDGAPFAILKLRTMVDGSDRGAPSVSGTTDPRVTPLGRRLRATRLDELPQLVNMLRGDMTLIGPRPEVPRFLEHYSDAERQLLRVRPGVIGPGALLFAHDQAGELDAADDPDLVYVTHHLHPKLALDLDYVCHRTLRRDLSLLAGAARTLLGRS